MTKGIHHITAISSDPQKTYDFYSKILGLRLVKKTVNQDDTETYHLFFGDKLGHPGMDLTFFTFKPVRVGLRGNGFVTKISFAVPKLSLSFWQDRFEKLDIKHESIKEDKIVFYDGDDQRLELVGLEDLESENNTDVWETDDIDLDYAIRSFYSATLEVEDIDLIEKVLKIGLGYKLIHSSGNSYIYKVEGSQRGAFLEVIENDCGQYGISGAGTVHHIAFRADDLSQELEIREKLSALGLYPTEVINRFYFKSVYFKTPAGVLFEIATDKPGFTADEDESTLGEKLALPPFLEDQREEIESKLTPINI
jgi:glyoxalase family protein